MRPPTPLTSFLLPLLRCFGFASFCWRGRSRRAVLDGGEITISEKITNHAAPDSSALVPFSRLLLSSFVRPGVSTPSFFSHSKIPPSYEFGEGGAPARKEKAGFGAAAPGLWGAAPKSEHNYPTITL